MALGISVPAVAFPVEEMHQAESAGSSMALSAGFFVAPSELPALPLERGGNCAWVEAGLCVSQQWGSVRHKWSDSTGVLDLDIISSSAKVVSLILTASSLSVLPWASCKTKEILLFCFVCHRQQP